MRQSRFTKEQFVANLNRSENGKPASVKLHSTAAYPTADREVAIPKAVKSTLLGHFETEHEGGANTIFITLQLVRL